MRSADFPYLPKDFIQTAEGLIFAVVSYQPQSRKVGCFLRYVKAGEAWQKVNTEQANQLLQNQYPQYLYRSQQVDAHFHAVAITDIIQHHKPEQRLQTVINCDAHDEIEGKCQQLIRLFQQYKVNIDCLGLTGSMLIGQQKSTSDIDFAVYGRDNFQGLRKVIQQAIEAGHIDRLDLSLMRDNFKRRDSDLSYDEFAWHEQRKFNKAALAGTKFDIGMVCLADELIEDNEQYVKLGHRCFSTTILNADLAFDFPACYQIDDAEIGEVLSFTPTYSGQALTGEQVEVSGVVEQNNKTGQKRLIVGSTREARGEYIKVISHLA